MWARESAALYHTAVRAWVSCKVAEFEKPRRAVIIVYDDTSHKTNVPYNVVRNGAAILKLGIVKSQWLKGQYLKLQNSGPKNHDSHRRDRI